MKFLFFIIFFNQIALADFRTRANKTTISEYNQNDVKAEIEFGRSLAARLLTKFKLSQNKDLQKYISTLGAGLANMVGRPELTFHFAVVESSDINAYACPGGYIFLTSGLMKLIQNEAQLVGVLAHEIHHVNDRHVIKKLKIKGKDDSAISGLGAMIGGATASFRVAIKTLGDEAMNILFNEGLMKSEEMDSDKLAIRAMDATGYDVLTYKELLLLLKRSMETDNARVLAKTHPKIQDRVRLVEKFKNSNNNKKINQERFKQYVQL